MTLARIPPRRQGASAPEAVVGAGVGGDVAVAGVARPLGVLARPSRAESCHAPA